MASPALSKTAQLRAAFWLKRWPAEARLARRVTWIGIGLSMVGIAADWAMVRDPRTFWILTALRLVSAMAFVPMLILAGRERRSSHVDFAALLVFAGLSALQASLPVLKPTDAGIQGASQLVIFLLWCFFYPGRIRFKVIGGLVGWAAWAGVALHQHLNAGYSNLTDFYTVLPGQLAACVLAPLGLRFLEQAQLRESMATERLALLNAQLEKEVEKRARREEQLSAAKLAAEEANRAKSVFLARMSHELRTPLGGVLGAAGAFDESALQQDQRALLEMMRASGQVLRTLVDEVLDLERIETGKLELREAPTDVRQVVERAVDVCSVTAYAKGLEIVGEVQADVPARVVLDGDRVEQVLINLLGNAVKFTSLGEVCLSVRCIEGRDGPRLELRVSDTGRGIHPDLLETVFEPYDRGDPDMERRFGGSGLGLAISRRIVEAMRGEIRVESEVDHGSVFTVQLPAPVPPEAAQDGPDELGDPLPTPDFVLRGVVLISKSQATRRALVAAGAFYDVTVHAASSLEQGMTLWRAAGSGDPVVLDGDADPGSWGAGLAEAMGDKAPRVVAVRPLELATLRKSGATQRFSAVTTKPVTLRRIDRALREAVQGQPERLPAETRPLRVMVVDDDLVSRKIAQSLIRRLGHEVEVASDGTSALEAAGAHHFDVYVIDLHMPDMMGTDLARALRKRWGPEPYLIALTAAAMPEDQQRCLDAGMNGFLSKPVDVESLRDAFGAIPDHE